jgi:hypothetical protein
MLIFAVSIFLSAFLLFQVQPMIGKFILPWFGGTPAVWSTVMLFFQAFLTGGYAYAYWLIGRVKERRQGLVHVILLGVSVALLAGLGVAWPSPIMPSADWKPSNVDFPIFHIILLLTASVGLPYFVLASNGPLMQAWFSKLFPAKSYARLYALSNVGSLLGLLTYPVLVEPSLTLRSQGWAWSIAFTLFALLAVNVARRATGLVRNEGDEPTRPRLSAIHEPSSALRALWVLLSATASIFLLSVTNQISQEVAVVPFLWILPLAVYLLSFILTFSEAGWYHGRVYSVLFLLASAGLIWGLANADSLRVLQQIAMYCALLFLGCMICHGELYGLRPSAEHLTSFYLMISLGGAAGGIFVNLIAPILFTGYWELYLAWLLVLAMLVAIFFPRFFARRNLQVALLLMVFLVGAFAFMFGIDRYQGALFARRNFYGILRVLDWKSPTTDLAGYAMIHGMTVHGIQYSSAEYRDRVLTYYAEGSGIDLALTYFPRRGEGLHVGVLGLGTGTLAAKGEPGDSYRFYEINPVVIQLAEGEGGYFSFLGDSTAEIAVVPGDGRISLERELAEGDRQNFDVLALDTFSSDSIPVHLVTREAFALYLAHLAPGGIIAAHISNRHIDLQPVFWKLAQDYRLSMVRVDRQPRGDDDAFPSIWLLLARDEAALNIPEIRQHAVPLDGYSTSLRLWTDDYSNLFQILK